MKITKEMVIATLPFCDGHQIWAFKDLYPTGLPGLFVAKLVRTFTSDFSDPKATIFDKEGNSVEKMEGIYSKTLTEALCDELDIDSGTTMIGRGAHVRILVERLKAHFDIE